MGLAETAQLTARLDLKGNFNRDIGKAQKGLSGFKGKLAGLGKQAKSSILMGVGMGGGMLAFGALTSAVSGTIGVLGNAVKMAAEEEAAIAQLTKAIEENDEAWNGNIQAVEDLITKRQDLAYSDGEQRESLQLLIGATKDLTAAEDLLGTAMDFARFRNIDLKTSADLLGRAYAGNFGTLSRYGVVLEKGATATEALAQIQKMASGQAKAYADTTQGKLVRAQIALDDAMEDLGRTLTPLVADLAGMAAKTLPEVVQGLKDVGEQAGKLIKPLQEVQGAVDDIIDLVPPEARGLFDDIFMAPGGPVIGSLDELQGALQEVQRATVGVNEDTDPLAYTYDVLSSAAGLTSKKLEEVAVAEEQAGRMATWAANRAKQLTDAIRSVADSGFGSIKSEAKSTQQAIKEALKTNSWAALAKERKRLTSQRAKYSGSGDQYQALAIIDARLAEVKTQIGQHRRTSRAYRGIGPVAEGAATPAEAMGLAELLASTTATQDSTTTTAEHTGTTAGHTGKMAEAIAAWPTNFSTALSPIVGAIATMPPPPPPTVNVYNNISATTVETNIKKVVTTNRQREGASIL